MKKRTFMMAAAVAMTGLSTPVFAEDKVTVAVSQIVEHPALDAARNGLLRGLNDAGYSEDSNLTFEFKTAQGNPATAVQIAREFVGEKPDVLVGIATPTAQALVAATTDIPIVFSAVTDPVGASLLSDMAAPDGNVTGLSDRSPVAQHLELMAEILPDATTVGVVYNPGESNAQSIVDDLKVAAEALGLTVVESPAVQTADVLTASRSLIGRSDYIYAPADNTVATAIDIIVQAATDGGIPVFAGSNTYVESGALIGLGFDYDQIGYQTAEYVVAILEGATPASLPARVATGSDIVINAATAEKLGITLSEGLLGRAATIVE